MEVNTKKIKKSLNDATLPFLKDLVGVHRAGNRLPKINLFFPIRPVIASGLVWHIVLEKASLRCKVPFITTFRFLNV